MTNEPFIAIRTYLIIIVALIALTLLTVGISFLSLSTGWHLGFGLSVGVLKASLVALYFMHLIHCPRLMWMIVIVSLVWLLGVLMVLTYCDYLTRGLIQGMPGH